MPINLRTLNYIDVYLRTQKFPEDTDFELNDEEVHELFERLSIRFAGNPEGWTCFLETAPEVSSAGSSKVNALASLLARIGLQKEDFL